MVLAQPLDISNKVRSGVGAQIHVGQRPTAPGPSLVEQHNAVSTRIEEPTLARRAARTGSAMQKSVAALPPGLPQHSQYSR